MARRWVTDDELEDTLFAVGDASDEDTNDTPAIVHTSGEETEVNLGSGNRARGTSVATLPPPHPASLPSPSNSDAYSSSSPGSFYGRKRRRRIIVQPFRRLDYSQHDDDDEEAADDPVPYSDTELDRTSPTRQTRPDLPGTSTQHSSALGPTLPASRSSSQPQLVSLQSSPVTRRQARTTPVPAIQVPATANSNSAELKSRKRARGPLQSSVGTPLIKLHTQSVKAKNGSVWHRDPNPNLPRMSAKHMPPGGLTMQTNQCTQPDEFFKLFIPDIELAAITYYTNNKIDTLKRSYRDQDKSTFGQMSLLEMNALLGILIVSGIKEDNHVGTSQMWSTFDGCPLYRTTMSNKRFCFLMRALRFDDGNTRQQRLQTDKLAPIRAIWESCVGACRTCYVPGPHFTVDEQLLGFRGHCTFRMYIANKPAKYGLKIVMLCDADTHFMCNAMPYLGKRSVTLPRNIHTHGEYYLVELTKPYPRRGRTVTSNNWFSTLQGALTLRDRGLDFVGTIKPKPYLPKGVFDTELEVKQSVAVSNYENEVTLVCHRANKNKKVQLLSTIHYKPTVIEKNKTDIQMFYNATKGGVDMFDQLCTKTSCSRMTNRWPLCFFFGIINLAYTNSYILHQVQTKGGRTMTRRGFGMKLAEQLTKLWAMKRLQKTQLPRELRVLIGSVYGVVSDIIVEEPRQPQQGPRKRMRCQLCPRNSNRKSRDTCATCKKYMCSSHSRIICDMCAT